MGEKQKREIEIDEIMDREKIGLGGWLIIFQVQIYLSMILVIIRLVCYQDIYSKLEIIIATFLILTLTIVCLVLFYKKSIQFRIFYTVTVIISLAYSVYVLLQTTLTYELLTDLLTNFVASVLIVGGLFTSKRVKNTFK